LTDTKNADSYNGFVTSTWQPRFKAFTASIQSAASDGTPPVPATPAAGTCSDFVNRLIPDMDPVMNALSGDSIAATAPVGLSAIKLRYKYEDVTPPADCGAARDDIVKIATSIEDISLAQLLIFGDTANASTYGTLMTGSIQGRFKPLFA